MNKISILLPRAASSREKVLETASMVQQQEPRIVTEAGNKTWKAFKTVHHSMK